MKCPCGRSADYEACCGRVIEGAARPPRAVDLMRSRYTAFVLHRADWLAATVPEPPVPGARSDYDFDAREWTGLEVRRVEAGKATDEEGRVEFRATYTLEGREQAHHERSDFHRVDGRWLYVGGETLDAAVGRNAPCPCGSGRKHKRCCGR